MSFVTDLLNAKKIVLDGKSYFIKIYRFPSRLLSGQVDDSFYIGSNDTSSAYVNLRGFDKSLSDGHFVLDTSIGWIVTSTQSARAWAVPHECDYVLLDNFGKVSKNGEFSLLNYRINVGQELGQLTINKAYYCTSGMDSNTILLGGYSPLSHVYQALAPLFSFRKVVL